MPTSTVEDYLKCIYREERGSPGELVSTGRIAVALKVSPGTVTAMMKTLTDSGLVVYTPYMGVKLTEAGLKLATHVLRRHRLIELFLVKVMKMDWSEVHQDAEVLEHAVSERLIARMDEMLGRPVADPHGDPIPTKDGQVSEDEISSLWEAPEGQTLRIQRVSDRNSEVLRHLASLRIYPQVQFALLKKAPFNGPVHIRLEGKEHILSEELARQIFVTPV